MKGSEKQTKWAEEIRTTIAASLPDMSSSSLIAKKAKGYLLSIDDSRFWIDHRDWAGMTMLTTFVKDGLAIQGFDFSTRAKMDQKTGKITLTGSPIQANFGR